MLQRINSDRAILAPIIGVTAGAFVVDLATPLGYAPWVLYFVPVMLCLFHSRPIAPLIAAGISAVLIAIGFVVSPPGLDSKMVASNRAFGVLSVCLLSFIVRRSVIFRLRMERQDWIRTGQAVLAEKLHGDLTPQSASRFALQFLIHHLGASFGAAFVLADDDSRFTRASSYALGNETPARLQEFRHGDGLLGQAAADKKTIVLHDVGEAYLAGSAAFGEVRPRTVLLVPILANTGVVKAVFELGFLGQVGEREHEFLAVVNESIGMSLKAAIYRQRLEALLEETQRQSEELQLQQEALRVTNEELEQQSRSLKESQTRIESQQTELEATNRQLEEQAAALEQQTSELTQAKEELQRGNDELTRASQYKSEFLANMSHELRTPLNSSLIMAKLLADNPEGNLNAEQVEFAETIYGAGNDLLSLINDILDLSKVEAGRLELRPEPVNVRAILKNLARIFEPIAKNRGLDLSLEAVANSPEQLETDPQRLEQILKNLLSNALKFTEQGSVAVKVNAAAGGIAFEVRDTGIGIDADKHEIIFEAFRQADGTTNRKYGGTGLGLSISRELARLLGGEISLESAPGEGSVFTLTLPLKYVPVQRPEPLPALASRPVSRAPRPSQNRPEAAPATEPGPREGAERTLLIIEDDHKFADILVKLSKERGFKCCVAYTADAGCAAAMEQLPDAILLDINLPDHSGLSVLDRLKHSARTRHIPIHVVSAEDESQAAFEMGAIGYLRKPATTEVLRDALVKIEDKIAQKIRRVLVVEDDPAQRTGIKKLIGNGDVYTDAVGTAAEALKLLRAETYDCMIVDLSLPDLSGYDLLETMSREDNYPHPPVIVYTGRSLTRDEEDRLRKYSKSIIIKGAKSPERLLSEVTLFLHKVESRLPAERQRMLQELRSRERTFDGRKILLVDDDVRNVFALGSALEKRGARVEIARNGLEALAKLEKDPSVDLVLMDIMMPEMDGLQATREIRRRAQLRSLPIIMVTAKAMQDDRENSLAAGANDYISKPVDLDKLLSLIRVWMPISKRS